MVPLEFRRNYLENILEKFDAVATFSSVEHSGLGRFGDMLNPWGDISSVSGPYRPITPYVKPFFPPELCNQPSLITSLTPFHRISRLYDFFVVLFARVSRFNLVFTL
jgi:hypothetical protein